MAIAGFIVLVFGLLVTGCGVVGGVLTMARNLRAESQAAGLLPTEDLPTDFLDAMGKFTGALADAPEWLALTVIGLVLVFVGASLLYRTPQPA